MMRLRILMLACTLVLLGSFAAVGPASAAPRHNHHLTIAATPDPVIAGEGVVIYGRLLGPDNGGQTIVLYHHIFGGRPGFRVIGTTTTDPAGYYEFTRAEGIVYTNRDWFVRGPDGSHSRTVHERVMPLVSINVSSTSTDTNRSIVFFGHVIPNHRFEQVFLQQQIGSSDDWRTLRATTLDPGSNYFVAYRWRRPGVHAVRALFRGDDRNVRGFSDVVTVTIQQAQVPGFTINSSDPIVSSGGSIMISGALDKPGSSQPEPNTLVQLWGRSPDHPFAVLADTVTGLDGSYSFTQSGLTTNMIYYVATMRVAHSHRRHTALLYQGVQDVLTMQASASSASTDQTVTFTGTVLPDKAGHVIYLQKLGKDGDWHTVEIAVVRQDSTFAFNWTMGAPGTYSFRARITGDEDNVGAASPPVTVTATTPAASTLPPAS